ncbi:glycosyltransferase [Marinobacter sp. M216]|uniref:Glycosyltransferase n=1 Tax=Marinobacter albus TaxID=3030833 RepID=A0ABT7HA68_9GAMM|nr:MULTISPECIES: glycosyltransferase [unclassified Marinobacter]MBW7470495.1 glycosyltransferase [Marinobacter sp. F4218]MDK9557237.1 glycosyltransferase [Marinobacter sp. M216]
MNKLPFVSVIVPYFNAGVQIKSLLQALLRQSYPHELFEVILVNNGSTDETQCLVESFLSSGIGSNFRLVDENEIIGSYAARNKGIPLAHGELLAFTDSDCTPEPDWIEQGVAAVCSNEQSIIGGRVELQPFDQANPTPAELFDLAYGFQQQTNIEKKGFSVTANLFVKREVFQVVGVFNAKLKSKGDYEWCNRAASQGFLITYQPSCVVNHPARRKIAELVAKTRRIAGGQYDIGARPSGSVVDVPSLPVRLAQQVKFVFLNKKIGGIRKKCFVVGIGLVLVLVKYVEKGRLILGAESRRS